MFQKGFMILQMSRNHFFLWRGIFFVMIFSVVPLYQAYDAYGSSGRGNVFERFKKPMPKLTLLSENKFLEATKLIKKKPYGEEVLEYKLRIPKSWTVAEDKGASNFLFSDKLFLQLNVFYGKPTISGRSRIEIQALNLNSNLTAEQWYLKYILDGGYTTEGLVTHSPKKIESLIVVMENDYSYYVRTLLLLNGNKVVMLKYFVPSHYIQAEAAMQEQVLRSFSLMHKIEKKQEDMARYLFLDIAALEYPKDWKIHAKPLHSVDRMSMNLLNSSEFPQRIGQRVAAVTNGKLDVTLISFLVQDSVQDELQNYKQKLEENGILIGEKIKIDDSFLYDELIGFKLTEVYTGVDSMNVSNEYEFWFTVLIAGNYSYFLTLLTPSRNERFSVWAKNTQDYKQILENFTPLPGAFLERN